MTRLDKFISDKLNITRSQAKALIKNGAVTVNGTVQTSVDFKCSAADSITANGAAVDGRDFVYIMMNKPQGVICATDGKGEQTVLDLLPDEMRRKNLFPAGRLDKDTTGFVLLTDDGAFAHRLLSPKSHIVKTYIATLDKPIDSGIIADFERGMTLGEEMLLPAKLTEISKNTVQIEICQGIYHQIKRMFAKHGITVLTLRRVCMGGVWLDESLAPGACRYLSEAEIAALCQK